jgi:hypothetical protein
MKPTIKKLILRKEALRTLSHHHLGEVRGGASPQDANAVLFDSGKMCPAQNAATTPLG